MSANSRSSCACADRAQSARSPTDGWDFPKLGIRGLQNFLKLRTRHRFNDRLTADLGVDINALNQAIIPRAALSYQVLCCAELCYVSQLTHGQPRSARYSNKSAERLTHCVQCV